MTPRGPSVTTVRNVVLATALLTLIHFTDNVVSFDTYPQTDFSEGWLTKFTVAISWPIFTAVGIVAYRLYRRGRHVAGGLTLALYSYAGLVSLGHFTAASPADLTTRGVITVFIDVSLGVVVLATAVWILVAERRGRYAAGGAPKRPSTS